MKAQSEVTPATQKRHDEQLFAQLDLRKQELLSLQEQVREERVHLQRQREDYQRQGGVAFEEVTRAGQDLKEEQARIARRRERLLKLQRRLRQRWHQTWTRERTRLEQYETELSQERSRVEEEREAARQERDALAQFRLQTNGESELLRRQIQAERIELENERQRHASALAEMQRTVLELDGRQQALDSMKRDVERQKAQWQRKRQGLEKEVQGLETRVHSLRVKLTEAEARLAARPLKSAELVVNPAASSAEPQAAVGPAEPKLAEQPSAASRRWEDKLGALEQLAGELADQRLYLAEHCSHLLQSQQAWEQERQAAAAALEAAALKLLEREQGIIDQEQALDGSECALKQRQKELSKFHLHLEAWKSRVAAREVNWQGTQERLLEKIRVRENIVAKQLAAIQVIRHQWITQRRSEKARLESEFQQAVEMRERYHQVWQECQAKLYSLHKTQRTLAERTLALDRYQFELTGDAQDASRAERRIAELTKEQGATLGTAIEKLEQHHETLSEEGKRLAARVVELEQLRRELQEREQELFGKKIDADQDRSNLESERQRAVEELQSARNQCKQYQQQLGLLNEELERVVNSLLRDSEVQEAPLARAA